MEEFKMERDPLSPGTKKRKNLFSFFSKLDKPSDVLVEETRGSTPSIPLPINASPVNEHMPSPEPNSETYASIERDPGKRKRMSEHPDNERDRIRRAYVRMGPYQPKLLEYPSRQCGKQMRRFQEHWYTKFPWLEYSPTEDKAYCFYCFLFLDDNAPSVLSSLATVGFNNWKRVNQGDKCAFLTHIGSSPSSYHNICVRNAEALVTPSYHIDEAMHVVSREESQKVRLRTTILTVQWLALQGCAFSGLDESSSLYSGNFLEMVDAFGKMHREVGDVALGKALENLTYTSSDMQKEILKIMVDRVRDMICKAIGDAPYCVLVDEAQDASKEEQMCIILRFVDNEGILRERFFAMKNASDTTSSNETSDLLKNEISDVLVRHNLQIQNMRGQGYNGAGNMREYWNEIQALFLRDCPYAYYVHCFAHQLQLTLVSAAREVCDIWQFFSHLDNVVNIITYFPKLISELESEHRKEIEHLLAIGEPASGSGGNQIGILQRFEATDWSSHYESLKSLVDTYVATCEVFECLIDHPPSARSPGEVGSAYGNFTMFEFVFVLHFMRRILAISDVLCQALQKKNQDMLTTLRFVHTTKSVLQTFREDGWEEFLQEVTTFCSQNDIYMPDFSCLYKVGRFPGNEYPTVDHHYHYDVFNKAIDLLLEELNTRFNDRSVELLSLCAALDPKNSFESFNIDDICKLAEKFYPRDFTPQDIFCLKVELQHYQNDVVSEPRFQVPTLTELCQKLVTSGRSEHYVMLTRLISLVLTLPVSAATPERAFSAMEIVKKDTRNIMGDSLFADCTTLYIEREYTMSLDIDSIMDELHGEQNRWGLY